MPVLMPTADEIRRMTPDQRRRVRSALWSIVRETDAQIERVAASIDSAAEFGRQVRDRARELEKYEPQDPDEITAQRRRDLMEAI